MDGHLTLLTGMAVPEPPELREELAGLGQEARWVAGDVRDAIVVLFRSPGQEVPPGPLRRPGIPPGRRAQAIAWLAEIFPGVPFSPDADPSGPSGGRIRSEVRQALPAIAALLAGDPGGALVLMHPESLLHPRSQSALASLACSAAAAGARLVVLTQSDHVLNATRLAVASGLLPPGAVTIRHYRYGDDGTVIADSPAIGPDGMLPEWPPGFFDEWDRALDQLLDAPGQEHPAAPRTGPAGPRRGPRGTTPSRPRPGGRA